MHGLPPAILDEDRPRALIGGPAPDASTGTDRTQLSTGRGAGVGTTGGAVHARPMTSTVAHLLLAPLLAVSGLGTGPAPGPVSAVWPLDPRPEVVERFDPPAEQWGAGHRGVDLLGSPGQGVRAARDGTVTFAGILAGRGVVVVSHGARRTTYEPVHASVHVGDAIRAGQPIGVLEIFGSHCWPRSCLHWGLIEDETYLDPLSLVGAGPVRLLPLFSEHPAAVPSARTPVPVTPSARLPRPGGVLGGRPGAVGLW